MRPSMLMWPSFWFGMGFQMIPKHPCWPWVLVLLLFMALTILADVVGKNRE